MGGLWMVCVFAVLGLCSCALSAERSANSQQDAPPAQPKQAAKKTAATDPNKFAIVVAGVGGEEAYTKKFTAQALRLYETLTGQLGFAEKNVYLLTEVGR
jgi:hypothetical protein